MAVRPALIGTGKGKSEVHFALGVKSGDICGRPCSSGDSCQGLAPISVKLYQLHMAAYPSPVGACA